MRSLPTLPSLVLLAVLSTSALAGCGGDEDDGGASGGGGGGSSQGSGSGDDAGGDAEPAASGPEDICAEVTAEEMSTAMGTTGLTVEQVPGGGCNFADAEDPAQPSVVLDQAEVDDANGGFEGTKAGVTATIVGESEDLDGVGDEAFVATGTLGGGDSVNGGGGVLLGDVAVQVTLLAGGQLDAAEVRQRVVDVLTLVASKA